MNRFLIHFGRIFLLLLIQILIADHVHLLGFINPYIYLFALLLLPFEMPRPAQYLIAFCCGLIIDTFSMTLGVHASASLLVIFLRPYWVSILNERKKSDKIERPIPCEKKFKWLLSYTLVLVFIHHFTIILLEAFTFRHFLYSLLISIANTIFTTSIILCADYIVFPKK
jgi:hypothetical protein